MRNKIITAAALAVAAVFGAITAPSLTSADDTPPRIVYQHTNYRLLDTRPGPKPTNGWTTKVNLPDWAVDAVDWEFNVQVVGATAAGRVDVGGLPAVIHDGGRDNSFVSVYPESGGQLAIKVVGGSTDVIIDLIKVTSEVYVGPPVTTVPAGESGT